MERKVRNHLRKLERKRNNMKSILTKILEVVGYLLVIGFGFTILYFGFQLLESGFRAIFK